MPIKKILCSNTLRMHVKEGLNLRQIAKKMACCRHTVSKRMKELGLISLWKPRHTDETKQKLSNITRERISKNPLKWHSLAQSKNISQPCERVKNWLRQNNINFVEEYQPLLHNKRFYSIDIAFPDKKIGIEINGNQHYNRDKTLKPYYQNRHNLITADGWILHEWHYSLCYKENFLNQNIPLIIKGKNVIDFDYNFYLSNKKEKKNKSRPKSHNKSYLLSNKNQPKYKYPSLDELKQLTQQFSVLQISKNLNISYDCLRRYIKKNNINAPSRAYWMRIRHGYTPEEAKNGNKIKKIADPNWRTRPRLTQRKVMRPEKAELQELIKQYPMTTLAKKYGVSDNAIRKWCKSYQIDIKKQKMAHLEGL